jgi:hypothetical protein
MTPRVYLFAAFFAVCISAIPFTGAQDVYHNCGMSGRTNVVRIKALNRQKNRYVAPSHQQIDSNISLRAMLQPGNDANRFRTDRAAVIVGYVVSAKPGGIESCNCWAKEVKWRDTHIDVAMNPQEASDKTRRVIVEVTPRWRAIKAKPSATGRRVVDWSTPAPASSIVGKWVIITGWMFFDGEHANAAENTHPNGKHNWRATAWEVHPMTDIQLTGDPRVNPLNQIFRRDLIDSPSKANQRTGPPGVRR